VMLCHGGPCPKCPKQVTNSCFCEQSSPRTLRCYAKTWSCGKECSKGLACEFHKCTNVSRRTQLQPAPK
jgi:NF-X1-type zinc finger protein NFXL1